MAVSTKAKIIVAVDGPAGSGKSTVARAVAQRLCLPYIDTGAMYRALTYAAVVNGVDWSNEEALRLLAERSEIDLKINSKSIPAVWINGEDVSVQIRTPELTQKVHYVAACVPVRNQMVRLQRRLGAKRGGVLEGRDIGTVVFPRTPYKIYLDGCFEIRASRRYKELRAKGVRISLKEVKRDLCIRDNRDFGRTVGSLRVAAGAVIVDSTALTVQNVTDIICSFVSSGIQKRASACPV